MEEARGDAERNGVGVPKRLAVVGRALLGRREVVATLSALVGLGIGVVIGRESIQGDIEADARSKVSEAKGRDPAATAQDDAEPQGPTNEFRIQLGRRIPKGARGFEPLAMPGRRAAQIAGSQATLPFEIEASADAYALTAIIYVENGKNAELTPELDGKPATAIPLREGWNAYSSPLPKELLGAGKHELSLSIRSADGKAVVALDSIAVAPVGNGVSFTLGPRSVGTLIEGFSKPSGGSVWSEGERSVLGLVVTPTDGVGYRLTVKGAALSHIAPLTVSAKVNGRDLGPVTFEKKMSESSWTVPAKTLSAGLNRVEFSYQATARPAEYDPKSEDKRLLALRFQSIALQPEG